MAKTTRNIGQEILDGLREIKRGDYGRVINVPDIASIREKTGLSQARFAQLLGVSIRTLQDWEQGRRAPSGAARTLLVIASKKSTRPTRRSLDVRSRRSQKVNAVHVVGDRIANKASYPCAIPAEAELSKSLE